MSDMQGLHGALRIPGDKSIAHRVLFFAAQAQGTTRIFGLPDGNDVQTTLKAIEALGARIDFESDETGIRVTLVEGWGNAGPTPCVTDGVVALDCGNSGTTARFLPGVLSGFPVKVCLDGDASLRCRPMRRLLEPLGRMGLACESDEWPIEIHGSESLQAITVELPVASAQMKTALFFAAIQATGESRIIEPYASRDHTERLAGTFGISFDRLLGEEGVCVCGPQTAQAPKEPIVIPGDPSSAAFWIVAALLIPESDLAIENVCLNPTRLGFVRALQTMGARIAIERTESAGPEPIGSIHVPYTGHLLPCEASACDSATLIDEVPVLALACCFAEGSSRIENIGELRHKECDRLEAILDMLAMCGTQASAIGNPDGSIDLVISGNGALAVPTDASVSAHGDHRIAMMWAVAAAVSHTQIRLALGDIEAIAVSYPGFLDEFSHRLGYAPIVCFE